MMAGNDKSEQACDIFCNQLHEKMLKKGLVRKANETLFFHKPISLPCQQAIKCRCA